MANLSRKRAKKIIEDIGLNKGWLPPKTAADSPKLTLQSLKTVREDLGAAIQTLATNLYSRETRFVFELIQNAEDNSYTRLQRNNLGSQKEVPYLKFHVYPDKIVVDSNEDGFNQENVEAICSTGRSSKVATSGYIGEKGIGFKSVFKVASKVHIQSGPFSFFFEHKHGDSGLGMVTPHWQDHEEIPDKVRTRITLSTDPAKFDQHVEEFSELPETLLLFLAKLKCLTLHIQHPDGEESITSYEYCYDASDRLGTLTERHQSSTSTPNVEESTRCYRVIKRMLTGLPHDDLRPDTRSAEVILAFPVDEDNTPIVKSQHVFAFLPLRKVGFSFLIQSDFIVQASREDVFHSDWNSAILSGVAEAFRDAVLDFCDHISLQYDWPLYLPDTNISDSFWAKLEPQVVRLLKDTPILRPGSGKGLKLPKQLKRVMRSARDLDGEPIFADLPEEQHLSDCYDWNATGPALKRLGVGRSNYSMLIARAKADLKSKTSRIKSSSRDDDWHTKAAKALMQIINTDRQRFEKSVSPLALIPLQDGKWVDSRRELFFPGGKRDPVPNDLGLLLVDRKALRNASRKQLFRELGVSDCLTQDVIDLISRRYKRSLSGSLPALSQSVAHIRYLYWNLPNNDTLDEDIVLYDHLETPIGRQSRGLGGWISLQRKDVFFDTDAAYGARKLFGRVGSDPAESDSAESDSAESDSAESDSAESDSAELDSAELDSAESDSAEFEPLQVSFIHKSYQTIPSADGKGHKQVLNEWLREFAGVRHFPRLENISTGSTPALSDEFTHLIRHQPEKLIGLLHAHWDSYRSFSDNKYIMAALGAAKVPCDNAPGRIAALSKAYLPTKILKETCKALGAKRGIHFVKLPDDLAKEPEEEWKFVKAVGTRTELSLQFYFDVLEYLTKRPAVALVPENVFKIYHSIDTLATSDEALELLRDYFKSRPAILIPANGSSTRLPKWKELRDCVWKADKFLTVKQSLKSISEYSYATSVKALFKNKLGVADSTPSDVYAELICESQLTPTDVDVAKVAKMYGYFEKLLKNHKGKGQEMLTTLRKQFDEKTLVFYPLQGRWYRPSQCLWADCSYVSDKVAIRPHYPTLEHLFVDLLGVERPNVGMLVRELDSLISKQASPSIDKVTKLSLAISSMGPSSSDLEELREKMFLPVRLPGGKVKLRSTRGSFAIVDRNEYEAAFYGKAPFLDYTLEQVRDMQPFLSALGLENRFLSELVTEQSMAEEGVVSHALTSDFRRKAPALYRCAVHYQPGLAGDKALYEQLAKAIVHETNGVTKRMTIKLLDREYRAESAEGNLHLKSEGAQLQLFVPRDCDAREICYLEDLPKRLLQVLAISRSEAEAIIIQIIQSNSAAALHTVLSKKGIINLSVPELPCDSWRDSPPIQTREKDGGSQARLKTSQGRRKVASDSSDKLSQTIRTPSPSESESPSSETRASYSYRPWPTKRSARVSSSAPAPKSAQPTPGLEPDSTEYVRLLDRVIKHAKKTSFPERDSFDFADMLNALPSDNEAGESSIVSAPIAPFGIRSQDQLRHDRKIGAAGELYEAFELLSSYGFPDFTRNNWQSTIRKEVRVHQDYANMPAWNGAETADIVYDDVGGEFTDLLYDLGHLSGDPFRVKRYYIEVKTTTGACGTRFFMSKAQYRRMKALEIPSVSEDGIIPGPREIYIILRVYNLGREDMDVKVYVDPMAWKKNKQLVFTAETWSIVPGSGET